MISVRLFDLKFLRWPADGGAGASLQKANHPGTRFL
jgi:hypothetical protein